MVYEFFLNPKILDIQAIYNRGQIHPYAHLGQTMLKVIKSYFSFFLMENSILYAKIAVSEFFRKLSFKYYIGLLFS